MADLNYDSYNFKEEGKFWGAPQQITWHMDRFRDAHIERMSAQTMMIEVKFDALIDSLKDIFTGSKENTGENESFYNMVQRENSETQTALDNYKNMMQVEMDDTQDAINNNTTRLYGAVSANTNSTKSAIEGQTRTLTGTTYNVHGIL